MLPWYPRSSLSDTILSRATYTIPVDSGSSRSNNHHIPVLLLLCSDVPLHPLQGQGSPIQIHNIKNFRMLKAQ